MTKYLTIKEVAQILRISTCTIYHNGPALYGGVKIGGLWRFPTDKVGAAPEPKKKEINTGYIRRFGKNKGRLTETPGSRKIN